MLNLIFLGTFNPPHRGHLECLRAALANREKYGYYIRFKDIYMIPAWQNPNKSTTTVSHKQRCAMCSEMIRDAENIKTIGTLEVHLSQYLRLRTSSVQNTPSN